MKKLLVIGRTFPEPSTTAAGGHMMDLLQFFQEANYEIVFTSTASRSERSAALEDRGIRIENIRLNHESFDELLHKFQPQVVLFDRFITEEQFGWRIQEILPDCMKVLDTEDLHFLRRARAEAHKQGIPFQEDMLFTDDAKRELASILRCDLSLIISEFEMELLQNTFGIPEGLLMYLPLLVDPLASCKRPPLEERTNFISVGNFHHAPNLDAVKYLKQDIWPLIRQQLPDAEIHIYGAYAPAQIMQMHKPKEGFCINGWTEDLDKVMGEAKVCLAPIRFGAGLKGKLMDAMRNTTPIVTTTIGAESMYGNYQLPGAIGNDANAFAQAAIDLYTHSTNWKSSLKDIDLILKSRFNKEKYAQVFIERLGALQLNLAAHRKAHFITQVIQHQSLQSTKYLSKWIEEKNR